MALSPDGAAGSVEGAPNPREIIRVARGLINETMVRQNGCLYLFQLDGENGGLFYLDLKNGKKNIQTQNKYRSTAHLMIHAYRISVSHNLNDFPCVTLLENILMDLFFRNKNIGAYVLFLNNDSPSKSLSHLSF